MAYSAQRVNFPCDQALALARQYQALADQVEATQSTRQGSKHLASDQWQGKFVLGLDSIDTGSEPGPPAVPAPRFRRHHRPPGPGSGENPPLLGATTSA